MDGLEIGSKGSSVNPSLMALKTLFESVCFPILDSIRADLGADVEMELQHNHAKLMNKIQEKNPSLPPSPYPVRSQDMSPTINKQQMTSKDQALLERCSAAEQQLQQGYDELSFFRTPIKA